MSACDDRNGVQLEVVDPADGGEDVLLACFFALLREQPQPSQYKLLSLGLGEDGDFGHGAIVLQKLAQ